MPRFFFHVMDGKAIVDTEGTLIASMGEVRREAIRTAGEILAREDMQLLSETPWQMTVADEVGRTVYSLRFESKDYPAASTVMEEGNAGASSSLGVSPVTASVV
jgi:hypothetical protein